MAASIVLPTHPRYVNGIPVSQPRKTLRMKEKYIIFLIFISFGFVCLGAFMFLPDLGAQVRNDRFGARDIFVPKPENNDALVFRHHPDEHQEIDRNRLKQQIQNDAAIQEKINISKDELNILKNNIQHEKDQFVKQQQEGERARNEQERQNNLMVEKDHNGHDLNFVGIPSDNLTKTRQQKVKEVNYAICV